MQSEEDIKDVDKLKTVLVVLGELTNVVNNEVVKKTVYNKLTAKVNNIDTSRFVLRSKYDTDKSSSEKRISDKDKKIPNISGLVKKTDCNAKITEIESKIPGITGLATTAALTTLGNNLPNVSNLFKRTDYDAKISGIKC